MQQPRKRCRASHPKVRTGCNTCKIRRVKCDERRPACHKCFSTGRKCEGYETTRDWVVVIAPPAPVTDGFEDDRCRRHFDYFRGRVVYQLSWFFDGGQWGELVLQESHSSPAVRHAVIAVACSHEDFADHLTVPARAPQYGFAAQHYSKAIRNLIKETKDDVRESKMRALVCGLLFISIEIMRGNNSAALSHLEGCLSIVRETQQRPIPTPTDSMNQYRQGPEAHLRDIIFPMIARLDVDNSLNLDWNTHKNGLPMINLDASKRVDNENESQLSQYDNVIQACNALFNIANRIHGFMQRHSDTYRQDILRLIPDEVLTDKRLLYNQLMQWETAIQPLLRASEHQHDYDKLVLMRIHNRTSLTLLQSSLHAKESLLDSYQWAFEDILNFITELQDRTTAAELGNSPCRTNISSISEFSATPDSSTLSVSSPSITVLKQRPHCFFPLDNGVIFSLYWTALKARDSSLRRRAVALLDYSSQEGVWMGTVQAAIAKRVIEIEEDQPYEQFPPAESVRSPQDIPEWRRVHSVETDIDREARRARLLLKQRLRGDQGPWCERVEWVVW